VKAGLVLTRWQEWRDSTPNPGFGGQRGAGADIERTYTLGLSLADEYRGRRHITDVYQTASPATVLEDFRRRAEGQR
jgi:hypothetical protein